MAPAFPFFPEKRKHIYINIQHGAASGAVRDDEDLFDCAYVQERLWILSRLDRDYDRLPYAVCSAHLRPAWRRLTESGAACCSGPPRKCEDSVRRNRWPPYAGGECMRFRCSVALRYLRRRNSDGGLRSAHFVKAALPGKFRPVRWQRSTIHILPGNRLNVLSAANARSIAKVLNAIVWRSAQ